ncbi:MAG: mitochondrial fission ELM1 family protein, partial [Caulobacteraceae bacterium]|nr:mitochondrial fission ELM1 family protein [Caulobacteraceae bacterium]
MRAPHTPIIAWAVTTGESGMRAQARGLAEAVADAVIEKTVGGRFAAPWAGGATADRLAPPWPDLLVTCGRRSAATSIAVRKASGGRTVTVHVQDPRWRANAFDLIVAMEHDPIPAGPKVLKVATALHDLTPTNLAEAARVWRGRLAPLGRPLAGVMIGGTTQRQVFTLEDGRRLLAGLERLRAEAGAALAISPSRRTPPSIVALLRDAFKNDPRVLVWDLESENPYRGILASADLLVVSGDSVSMVSEALCTSRPVEVFDVRSPNHQAFLDRLVALG